MHSIEPHVLNQDSGVMDAVFFSPHLDDAVLSCGNKLYEYSRTSLKVAVVTIFSECNPHPHTSDIESFLRQSNARGAKTLFARRKQEDRRALHTLRVGWYDHVGLVDGLFRMRQPHNSARSLLYPSFKDVFRGRIALDDQGTYTEVVNSMKLVKRRHVGGKTSIFVPLGVGTHVDHVIVHNAAREVFSRTIHLWEDVPYRSNSEFLFRRLGSVQNGSDLLRRVRISDCKSADQKRQAIARYRSQLTGLEGGGLGTIDYTHEAFYDYKT